MWCLSRKPGVCTSGRNTLLVTRLIEAESTQHCPHIWQCVASSEALHIALSRSVLSFFLLIAITSQRISGEAFISLINVCFSVWQITPKFCSTHMEKALTIRSVITGLCG